jgi:hypothetical protein
MMLSCFRCRRVSTELNSQAIIPIRVDGVDGR